MSTKKAPQKTNSVDFSYLQDKKLEKGKKKLLEQSTTWKKPSPSEKEHQRQAVQKVRKDRSNREDEKVSWKKRAAGVMAIVFLCGVGLFQFFSAVVGIMMGSGVTTIDVRDTPEVKRVLFGGDPWFVYCVNNETENQRLPDVLTESAHSLRRGSGVRSAVLRCWDETESGRSIAQRFKLRLKPPLSFVVVNGDKPRILNLVGIKTGEELEKRIKPALKLDIFKIDTLKKWSSLCTSRRACVVVGHRLNAQRDTVTTLLRPLQEQHRALKMVTLDTSFWQLKLDDAVLASRPSSKGQAGQGADVLCLARQEGAANGTHAGKFLHGLDGSSLSAFLTACQQQTELIPLQLAPRIKARPSKPKKVTPERPTPAPRPSPKPSPPKDTARSNVDHVGSREKMESEEEALFEAVDEGPEEEEEAFEESDDPADEVEL